MINILREIARRFLFTQNTLRYRVEFARLAEAFALIGKQEKVLDGGAGSGAMLRKLKEAGWIEEGCGVEPYPRLFRLMQDNFRGRPGLHCVEDSILKIPFADQFFDCAMSTQVLEHIEDHETAASELARVVKAGGYLVISVPHPPEPFPNEGHVREGYTEEDLRKLFPAPAFEHLSTTYFFTRSTLDRMMRYEKLPLRGVFIPVSLVDAESEMSAEERRKDTPFGIMTVFRKCRPSF